MIFFILDKLTHMGVKVPSVFTYYSTRMMLAAITSLILSIFLGPRFIKFLVDFKIKQSVRSEELLGELHQKKKNTPTMGGLLILFSMLVSMFLWMDLTHAFTLILLVTTLILGFLGGRDDYLKLKYKNSKGLAGRKKILIQVFVSLLLALYLLVPAVNQSLHIGRWFAPPIVKEHLTSNEIKGQESLTETKEHTFPSLKTVSLQDYASRIYIPFFKDPVFSATGIIGLIFATLFIIFVVTGSSNAVNLTDGLDGLAAGCLIMVATCLALIAFMSNNIDIASYLNILYIEGSGEIAIYLCAFIGACLGFLWYNGYPAELFMGDTGSLALGGIIGVSAVLLKREFLLGLVGGIFVAEAMSVIIQVASYKFRNKKRVFLIAPLHHHFEYKGWPETKVVLRFWIIGLLLAILGVASLKFQ
jgi:phospho-N-acetylmuramoyl-pentapeptide-transferase